MSESPFVLRNPGFGRGSTRVVGIGHREMGIEFGILRLAAGESVGGEAGRETAWLLMDGEAVFSFEGRRDVRSRGSLFDEDPVILHRPRGAHARMEAVRECEVAVFEVENDAAFETKLFDSESLLESEHRDRGVLENTSYRIVRTAFDLRNRPEAKLVLGEVVNFPGRWSSYPPHHHPQPEIYHYRFTAPQGYGHGEMGEHVVKLRDGDTLLISAGNDHSQVAAPGYGMYYIWAIRHLPGNPYRGPEFTPDHVWLKQPSPPVWKPRDRNG